MRAAVSAVLAATLAVGGLVLVPTPAQAAVTTYTHANGETVTYDTEAVLGETIHVEGTGWLAKPDMVDEGEEGSVIGFKVIDTTLGQLERQQLLDNPRLGTPITNATVWGVVWADSNGSFEVDLEWPDASVAKAGFVPAWEAGDSFTLQLLSGTLYSDQAGVDPSQRPDVSRTVALTITVADTGPSTAAPTVTTHPAPVTNALNASTVSFTAAASGEPAPTVQWQRSTALSASAVPTAWTAIAGATEPTLSVVAGTSPHVTNRWYRAVFTNPEGTVTTDAAKLTVAAAPTITQQPAGATISVGTTATFTAAASSPVATTVRWQSTTAALANGEPDDSTWADVAGATDATLSVEGVSVDQHGTFYRAVFTGSGSTATYAAQLRFSEQLDTNGAVTVSGESYTSGVPAQPFTVTAANAVVAGDPIVLSGTGYQHPDGVQGSVVNFFVDAAYSGDPNTLSTTRTITHPVTGAPITDKRSHAVIQAAADGTWQVSIPWPDATNTTQTAAFFEANWAGGTQHIVRVLTGSLLTGDHQRGISVRFTVVDEPTSADVAPVVTEQPTPVSVAVGGDATFTAAASGDPAPTVQWESSTDGAAWTPVAGATSGSLTVPAVTAAQSGTQFRAVFTNAAGSATSGPAALTVTRSPAAVVAHGGGELGGTVRLTGTDWVTQAGTGGSTIAVKWDDGAFSRVAGDTVHSNATIWYLIEADADGSFDVEVPVPTGLATGAGGSTPAMAPGAHFLRLLSGSLQAGDTIRSVRTADVTITASEPVGVAPVVTAQPGSASVVAGNDAVFSSAASGDPAPTVQWESSTDGGSAWSPVAGGTSGSLTVPSVTSGQSGTRYRAVFTNSAGSATSDVATLTVTRPAAAVVVHGGAAELGGSVRITGTDWVNQAGTGGSTIAVMIDSGAYRRLPGDTVHVSTNVWQVVQADADGSFDVQVALPTGSTEGHNGSTPAFPAGAHSFRLLTGSLQAGDTVRSVISSSFEVAEPTSASADVAGTVSAAGGESVAGAVAYLYAGADAATATYTGLAWELDESGEYAFVGLAPGAYLVAVSDPTARFGTVWTPVVLPSDDPLDVVVSGVGRVTVAPVDGTGAPVPGACVFVYAADVVDLGAANALYGSCADGESVVLDLPAGAYKVAVFDPSGTHRTTWVGGAATVAEAQVVTVTGGANDLGTLAMPPA